MKSKTSTLTIILIIFSLYLVYQTWDIYSFRTEKWNRCEEISNEKPESFYTEGTEDYNNAQIYIFARYTSCLDSYESIVAQYVYYRLFTLVSILLIALSWKFDVKNKVA